MREKLLAEIQSGPDYNAEPVFYCKNCLSLKVRGIAGYDYCDDCGGVNVGECPIQEWEQLYKERFGHFYLEEYNINHNKF